MSKETNALIDDFTDADEENTKLNLWNYREEKEILGLVCRINENGTYGREVFLNVAGDEKQLPSLVSLDTKLKKVVIGDKVKIIYEGEEKSNTSKYKYAVFKVFIKHSA